MRGASSRACPVTVSRDPAATPPSAGPISTFTSTITIKLRQPARKRNLELVLLILAIGIDLGTIALVQLGALGDLGFMVLGLVAVFGVLLLGLHVVLRVVAAEADPLIVPIITVLNGLGIAMIYRVDLADEVYGWGSAGVRQIVWSAIAVVIAGVVLVVIRNHRVLQRYRYVAMFSAIVLLHARDAERVRQDGGRVARGVRGRRGRVRGSSHLGEPFRRMRHDAPPPHFAV